MYSKFAHNIEEVCDRESIPTAVKDAYKAVYDFVQENDYREACHEMSAILFILLRELGVGGVLFSGELNDGVYRFDHSWVEVKGNIYDIAVAFTGTSFDSSPIFCGLSVNDQTAPKWRYLPPSLDGDSGIQGAHSVPFSVYMSSNPNFKNGTFGLLQKLGRKCGLRLNLNQMKTRYRDVTWASKGNEGGVTDAT